MGYTIEERLAFMSAAKAANVRAAIEIFKAYQHEKRNPQDQHERRILKQRIRRQAKKVMQSF